MSKKYNVIAQGARDYYELALSLDEEGLLSFLITDFYTPDWARSFLQKRYTIGLSSRKTKSAIILAPMFMFFRSSVFGRLARLNDFILGFSGAIQTYFGCGRAVVYSYYIEGFCAFYRLIGQRPDELICFQVHPTPWYVKQIIDLDTAVFRKTEKYIDFMPEIERNYDDNAMTSYASAILNCDRILCASDVTKRSLAFHGLKVPPTFVVPYGSKLEKHVGRGVASQNQATGPIKLITVGQVVQRKGLHWAFLAMGRLPLELQAKFEWTVISNKVDPVIAQLAPKNVRFQSSLTDAALADAFLTSDLFVMPSLLEGFGLVYIEALSMGLPVVYTAETGISDMCQDRKHGFRVRPSSVTDIETLFRELLAGHIDLNAMRLDCADLAAQNTWTRFRELAVKSIRSAWEYS